MFFSSSCVLVVYYVVTCVCVWECVCEGICCVVLCSEPDCRLRLRHLHLLLLVCFCFSMKSSSFWCKSIFFFFFLAFCPGNFRDRLYPTLVCAVVVVVVVVQVFGFKFHHNAHLNWSLTLAKLYQSFHKTSLSFLTRTFSRYCDFKVGMNRLAKWILGIVWVGKFLFSQLSSHSEIQTKFLFLSSWA